MRHKAGMKDAGNDQASDPACPAGAAEKAGVMLQIGFNRRFDHNFAKIRDLVKSGAVGQPHIVRVASRDPSPPAPEYVKMPGGIPPDMTIHHFDMARFVTGADVTEVYARRGVLVDPAIGAAGDVDTAVVTLTFDSGCLWAISRSAAPQGSAITGTGRSSLGERS
jgi:myo-inositol 2-dehydrogenase/D-chiro-inositol 1-dehydrogenase